MEDRADEIFYREDAACLEQPLAKNLGQQKPPYPTLSSTEVDLEGSKMSKKHHLMPARKCSECGIVLGSRIILMTSAPGISYRITAMRPRFDTIKYIRAKSPHDSATIWLQIFQQKRRKRGILEDAFRR